MKHFPPYVMAIGFVAMGLFARTAPAQVTYRTLFLEGDQVPGLPEGVLARSVCFAGTNDAGDVAFTVVLEGPGVEVRVNDEALFINREGTMEMLARRGDPPVGIGDGWVIDVPALLRPVLGDGGSLVSSGLVKNLATGAGSDAIFSTRTGEFRVVAYSSGPVPGLPGDLHFGLLTRSGTSAIDATGHIVFRAALFDSAVGSSRASIWTDLNGMLELLVRQGEPAPGTEPGTVFKVPGELPSSVSLFSQAPAMNASGTVLFSSFLDGPDVEMNGDFALFSGKPGALKVVARRGDAAPGTEPGVIFRSFRVSMINDAGQILVPGILEGPGVDTSNDDGLWIREPSGETRLVARAGDPVPGRAPDVLFSRFNNHGSIINGRGSVAFLASTTSSDHCLYILRNSGLQELACLGDQLPGLPNGVTLYSFSGLEMNLRGQVAFDVRLTGTGVTGDNNDSRWVADATGQLHKLVRKGDPFEVAPGDFRTPMWIDFLWVNGGENGGPRNFNNLGQYTFWASFTDLTTGIFVASLAFDRDGDGIEDADDTCPDEDATGLDANGDGCVDRLEDLPRVIREETSLSANVQRPLLAIVNASIRVLEQGNVRAALQALSAFAHRLRAQRGTKTGEADAAMLLAFSSNVATQLRDGGGLSGRKLRRPR